MAPRRYLILTEGHTNPVRAKTACCVIRYRPEQVVALLDGCHEGQTTRDVLGLGEFPIVSRVDQAPEANTLLIGIANPGGTLPDSWRAMILQAIERGMDIVSGMHEFLAEDPEFAAAAGKHGISLVDVRNRRLQRIARATEFREACLRVHTVGHDCSVGKMVVSVETTLGLQRQGVDAKFAATGQTGIIVEGDGYPIDCMVADFVSGAAEQLVLDHQAHEILMIEGQGSLVHPSYSGVTLGLLHGCRPHGLIFCYEPGRTSPLGLDHVSIPPLRTVVQLYEQAASIRGGCRVIGFAMNSRRMTRDATETERTRIRREFGLPVCDVIRHGPDELVAAVLALQQERAAKCG
jgi:uncharacterized NAD-dependent epimerase/dehydratase family protein